MKHNSEFVLGELKARLAKEEQNYIDQGLPDHVRLSKTRLFSSLRKQQTTSHKIAAIKMAISLMKNHLREVDIYSAVMMGISDRREDKGTLLDKAESIYLRERAQVAKEVIETHLPIHKKAVLETLKPYL